MNIILDRDVKTPTKKYLRGKLYDISSSEADLICFFADIKKMKRDKVSHSQIHNKIKDSNPTNKVLKDIKKEKKDL